MSSLQSRSHRALLVVFRVEQFLAAHGTDALLIGAGLAVVRAHLVHLSATYPAGGERPTRVRIEAVLAGSQRLVFADLAAAALCGVSRPRLPHVRGDHLAQLLLTLLTHHNGDAGGQISADKAWGKGLSTILTDVWTWLVKISRQFPLVRSVDVKHYYLFHLLVYFIHLLH